MCTTNQLKLDYVRTVSGNYIALCKGEPERFLLGPGFQARIVWDEEYGDIAYVPVKKGLEAEADEIARRITLALRGVIQ